MVEKDVIEIILMIIRKFLQKIFYYAEQPVDEYPEETCQIFF